ncbi:MAG: uroporphyrinogen-III synthase, partial [Bacteroidales bacterium]|nr:uroporphyrinogen-III synthase [Bacteroidales bacterium]
MSSLKNRIIISTRPKSDDDAISLYLREKGASVLEFPMIETVPAKINEEIKNILKKINSFNWFLFTSKNGVKYFLELLIKQNIKNDFLKNKTAVIGKTTANELINNGVKPYFVSSGNTSKDFLRQLSAKIIKKDNKILLPLGNLADNTFEKELSEFTDVKRIDVYKTREPKKVSAGIIETIKKDKYDIIVFTSPSGFRNYLKVMKENKCKSNFRIASIGKTTEKEILKNGYKPILVSSK